MITRIITIGIILFFLFTDISLAAKLSAEAITKTIGGSQAAKVSGLDASSILGSIFQWLKNQLLYIVPAIAVAVFVYVGIKMATSRGNPEEFKKAWKHLVYAVIGIFLIFFAWGIVNIVASINLS